MCVCVHIYIYTYIHRPCRTTQHLPKIRSKLLNVYRHVGGCGSAASRKYEKNRGARSGAATRKKNHHLAPRLAKFVYT